VLLCCAVLHCPAEVADIDLRWQYLYHQVHHSSSSAAHLHTQLATVLLAALAAHIGSSSSSGEDAYAAGAGSGNAVTRDQLAQMVHQLPISFSPNAAEIGAPAAAAAAAAFSLSGAAPSSSLQQRQGSLQHQQPLPLLFSSVSGTPLHSRGVSLLDGGIPSACFFAASVADIARRGSRDLHPSAATAAGSSTAAVPAQQQQQQRRQPYCAFEHQQLRQRSSLGALAGVPVLPKPLSLARQGSAAVQGFGQALHSVSGFGTMHGAQQQGLQGPSKTFSNIAQMMHQHQMRVASSTGNVQQQQQGLPSHLQPQPSLGPLLSFEPQALRVLPGGLGPWPVDKPQLADQADAPEAANTGSSSSRDLAAAAGGSAAAAAAADRPAAAAAAAAAAVLDKVLLLRCLLVYHLQASLLYDAKVGSAGGGCMHMLLHYICVFRYLPMRICRPASLHCCTCCRHRKH
jgi:hypothetical protein